MVEKVSYAARGIFGSLQLSSVVRGLVLGALVSGTWWLIIGALEYCILGRIRSIDCMRIDCDSDFARLRDNDL